MKPWLFLGPVLLSTTAAGAFVGMGAPYSQPYCAFACRAVISSANLTCTTPPHSMPGMIMAAKTTSACRAVNDFFLTSLAYCIKSQCLNIPIGDLELYWIAQTTGDRNVPAKWNYATTLQHINGTPGITWVPGYSLDSTMLVPQASWDIQYKFLQVMDHNSNLLYKYSIIILVVGFATPIAITLISKLPLASTITEKVNPYLVYPSTIGTYQVRPLPWLLGNAPTLGQAWYIGGFIVLNVILSCLGYKLMYPVRHPWGYNHRGEILAYAGYRTGEFAFALLPLTILFAGRNNILLWLTNWSHSTYLLLHRWIAWLFALHTVLHSIFLWAARVQTGTYATDVKLPYWKWGIVGTVFVCAMLIFSLLWIRRLSYEVFLIGHIIMAIFTIVGSWYHLMLRFGKTKTHEYWLYTALAVWVFDRLLRIIRIVKNGAQRAIVTEVGANHVRIDIPNIRFSGMPGYHGYVYFPTVNPLRPWENHPFSINTSSLIRSYKDSIPSGEHSLSTNSPVRQSNDLQSRIKDKESVSTISPTSVAGVTLYVRKSTGMTRHLQKNASLLTLLDGPYPNNPPGVVLACDRLILIGGGIGITGLLAFINSHVNIKLAWSLKASDTAIVTDMNNVLHDIIDKDIRIGERLDIDALLRHEAAIGYKKVGVVVCGPGSLSDDVRAAVASLGRQNKTIFELEVDAYSW